MTTQTEMMQAGGWLRASEAARRIGKRVSSLYKWIEAGHVVGTQVGRTWYVNQKSLAQYLGPEAAEIFKLAEPATKEGP